MGLRLGAMQIRTRLYEHDDEGHPTEVTLGEVVVDAGPPARLEIVGADGGTRIFSAPLEVLAWQLCMMEPRLARFLVVHEDSHQGAASSEAPG